MRVIDFQDGFYRSQPSEKVQSRIQNQPVDDAMLAQIKKLQKDEARQTQISESEQGTHGKQVEKDKEGQEKGKGKKQEKKEPEGGEAKPRRRPPDGTHLIDIDA